MSMPNTRHRRRVWRGKARALAAAALAVMASLVLLSVLSGTPVSSIAVAPAWADDDDDDGGGGGGGGGVGGGIGGGPDGGGGWRAPPGGARFNWPGRRRDRRGRRQEQFSLPWYRPTSIADGCSPRGSRLSRNGRWTFRKGA
ncbi:MAG: hypothetical protein O9972_31145 [Burkholderiales bacterium]|nr:hypothetical protein [Burkholderiales bacterium]